MSLKVDILQGGVNNHGVTVEDFNAFATDFLEDGVVGSITNTSGVSPATGAFSVNAQTIPDMTVAVTAGTSYITGTPTSGVSQRVRVVMDTNQNVTIPSNATGGTRYDWIYIKLDPAKMKDPLADSSDVATLVISRSTSNTTDNGTPPVYGYCIAIVTVANAASSIVNASVADKRKQISTTIADGAIGASELGSSAILLSNIPLPSGGVNLTTVGSDADITGMSTTVYIPRGKTVRVIGYSRFPSGNGTFIVKIKQDNVEIGQSTTTSNAINCQTTIAMAKPSEGYHTYKLTMSQTSAGTMYYRDYGFLTVEIL